MADVKDSAIAIHFSLYRRVAAETIDRGGSDEKAADCEKGKKIGLVVLHGFGHQGMRRLCKRG